MCLDFQNFLAEVPAGERQQCSKKLQPCSSERRCGLSHRLLFSETCNSRSFTRTRFEYRQ